MESFVFKLLAFVLAIGILVSVHEFGHFWVARRLGVKVLRFSIGFGRPLWRRQRTPDATEYVVASIPLGGYVKMLDEREGPVHPAELPRAFNRQSLGVRAAVVVAGPLFNLLFAIVAFWLVLVIGETGLRPLVGSVAQQSPAAEAGLSAGEEITSINRKPTPTWNLAVQAFAEASISDEPVRVEVRSPSGEPLERLLPARALGDMAEKPDVLKQLGITADRPRVPPIFGEVLPGEPAAQAGLQAGDRIVAADGAPINDWGEWVDYVRERPGRPIHLLVDREGQERKIELIPASREVQGSVIGRIGALNQPLPESELSRYRVDYRLGPWDAVSGAVSRTLEYSWLTLKVIGRIISGQTSIHNLSGPLSIADAAGKTASYGLVYFLKFLAVVSISLGVLNLLPIPVLDGGHLVYFLLEAVRGGPLPESWLEQGQRIGLALLAALMGLAFYVDIARFFG
jgi:regulator of sigma E protease